MSDSSPVGVAVMNIATGDTVEIREGFAYGQRAAEYHADLLRDPSSRELNALKNLPYTGYPASCSEWMTLLVMNHSLDVVGYLLARGWISIARVADTDAVCLSQQGMKLLGLTVVSEGDK